MKKPSSCERKKISAHDSVITVAKKVLKAEAEAINALVVRIGRDFERAIDMIHETRGRVVVTGMGKSGLVGKKIAATLASTGTPAFFLHPAEAIHGDLGMVTDRDIIIAISYSGETSEIVDLIPFLKRFGVRLLSMTGNIHSTLAKASDIALDISVREEACPMGIVPTASTTATMALGDALAVSLLVKKGVNEKEFALYHPGGSIGKRFFIKVSDLMHTGENLPLISIDTPMSRAVIEMSAKRLGHAVVIDGQGRIAGVITDGDVRRGLERWGGELFTLPAHQVMTKDPKTISREELAAKALSIMESYSITALIVPDEDKKPLGIVHLHDILKQGIV